jgi:hypothetical protein
MRSQVVKSDTNGLCPFCHLKVSVRWGSPPEDPGELFHEIPMCDQLPGHNHQRPHVRPLGTFKTAEAAAERCSERGALIFEQDELFRNGCNYGHSQERVVATVVGP